MIATKQICAQIVSHGMYEALQEWKYAAMALENKLKHGELTENIEVIKLAEYRVLLSRYGIDTKSLIDLYTA